MNRSSDLFWLLVTVALPWGRATGAAPLAYLADANDPAVTVVDLATKQVRGVIALPAIPRGLALSPSGTRLYVTHLGGADAQISVVDTRTNSVIARPYAGPNPWTIAVDPTGRRVYVVNRWIPGFVTIVDTSTNEIVAQVPVGLLPGAISVSRDGRWVYVVNTEDLSEQNNCGIKPHCTLTVSVIDATVDQAARTLEVGPDISSVAISPSGTKLYVSGNGGMTYVFDLTISNAPLKQILVGISAIGFHPSGDWLYGGGDAGAAFFGEGGLIIFDAQHDTVAAIVPTGEDSGPVLAPDGTRLYVAIARANPTIPPTGPTTIRVIDTSALEAIDEFEISVTSRGFIIGPDPNLAPPTPIPTPVGTCAGDCNGNRVVTVDELVRCVAIALGTHFYDCTACNVDPDGQLDVSDLVGAVNRALDGCPVGPAPAPTPAFLGYVGDQACRSTCDWPRERFVPPIEDFWSSQVGCCFYNQHLTTAPPAVWCPSVDTFSDSGKCLAPCVDPCQGLDSRRNGSNPKPAPTPSEKQQDIETATVSGC